MIVGKPETGAFSLLVQVGNSVVRGAIFVAGVLAAGEEIAVEVPSAAPDIEGRYPDVDVDGDWLPLMLDGSAVVITADNMGVSLPERGHYRIVKPVTAESVGVRVY